jgi:hypothetical protein
LSHFSASSKGAILFSNERTSSSFIGLKNKRGASNAPLLYLSL